MAIKNKDGIIINTKNKIKAPSKEKRNKNTKLNKRVWWVKDGDLWEGKVVEEENGIATVIASERKSDEFEEKIIESKLLSLREDNYEA